MTKKFSRFTVLMTLSLFVLCFSSFQIQATVGDIFTVDQLRYTILTEDGSTGTVNVEKESASISGSIIIPDSIVNDGIIYHVTSIRDWGFTNCNSLISIVIPNGISIGYSAFADCTSLTCVVIGDGVNSSSNYVFTRCNRLTSVYFEGNRPSMSSSVFGGSPRTTIYYQEGTEGWTNPWGNSPTVECKGWTTQDSIMYAYKSDGTAIVSGYIGELDSVVIPDVISVDSINYLVTSIGENAFRNCSSLTKVVIPDSITFIGGRAFVDCNSLASVYFKGNTPVFFLTPIGRPSTVYYLEGTEGWTNPWGNRPTVECKGWLTQDEIIYVYKSDGTAIVNGYIGELDSVVIPETISVDSISYLVTSIENYAFQNCISLTNVVIPNSITSVGDNAFCNCSGLLSANIGNGVTTIGDHVFHGCSKLMSITIPDSVNEIGCGVFYDCIHLEKVVLGSGIKEIKNSNPNSDTRGFFENCSSLTSIMIPDNVTSIGGWAFARCSSLTSITIPESVTSIGDYTFYECSSLTNITLPDSVTSIGSRAFSGCSSLENITIPDSVTSIGNGVFCECSSLMSITIPDGVLSIGWRAFISCSSLTSVMIPDSMSEIDEEAFRNCNSLTSVYFEGNAPSVGSHVFYDTPVTIYYREGTEGWTDPWAERPTTLWVEAPEVIEQPQSQTVMEGESVTFTVSVDGTTPLSYQWQKDGTDISGATDSSYTISNVTVRDTGSYRVVVSNSAGSVTSAEATLTVLYLGTATIYMNSDNPVIYGDSCGTLAGQKVSSDIWGVLLYNGQEVARQVFSSAAAGKPTGKLKGDIIETHLVPVGAEVTLQLAAFDQGYVDHPDTGHYYYGISKPFTYHTGDSKNILPDGSLRFSSFTIEWVDTPVVDEPVIHFELEGDGTSLVLDFVGTLYESDDAVNWKPVEDAKPPFSVNITKGKKFYRCAQ